MRELPRVEVKARWNDPETPYFADTGSGIDYQFFESRGFVPAAEVAQEEADARRLVNDGEPYDEAVYDVTGSWGGLDAEGGGGDGGGGGVEGTAP